MATTNSTSMSLKLLIDTTSHKVLFAEASKEVVDFLFSFLSFHVATVTRLLSTDGMVGCLGNLYQSAESLSVNSYLPLNLKDTLLKPKTTISASNILQLPLPTNNDSNLSKLFYICVRCSNRISESYGIPCPQCRSCNISTPVSYVSPSAPTGATSSNIKAGYVKGGVIYMIMDNLDVKPMTTESSVAVLQKFNVKGIDALQVKEVDLGMQEGLKLVKASLESNTALTNVFLGKKLHKLFNFGPLATLSFRGFILVCGLGFLFYYFGSCKLWSIESIGFIHYISRKLIRHRNNHSALSLIQNK
ncbi:unnamed protein product [Prunus armeniaca]